MAIPVEEANPLDSPLSDRQIVEEPREIGVRPTAQGQGVLDRNLDRSRHAGGTRVLIGHPRARFLLHTEHTVDTAHEQERQHEEQDEAESKPHGFGPMIASGCKASNRGAEAMWVARQSYRPIRPPVAGHIVDKLSWAATSCRE